MELKEQLNGAKEEERWTILTGFIAKSLRDILVIEDNEPLGFDTPFADLGLDSFTAVQLRDAIQKALGKEPEIKTTEIFDHPTVNHLSEYLAQAFSITVKKP